MWSWRSRSQLCYPKAPLLKHASEWARPSLARNSRYCLALWKDFWDKCSKRTSAKPHTMQQCAHNTPSLPLLTFPGGQENLPGPSFLPTQGELSAVMGSLLPGRYGAISGSRLSSLALTLWAGGDASLVCSSSVLSQWTTPNETSKFPDILSQSVWKLKKIRVCWLWEQEQQTTLQAQRKWVTQRARIMVRKCSV